MKISQLSPSDFSRFFNEALQDAEVQALAKQLGVPLTGANVQSLEASVRQVLPAADSALFQKKAHELLFGSPLKESVETPAPAQGAPMNWRNKSAIEMYSSISAMQ